MPFPVSVETVHANEARPVEVAVGEESTGLTLGVAEVVMDDKLLGQLKTAKTATFIIFETPEEGIGFPLSLNGLAEGYDKLP